MMGTTTETTMERKVSNKEFRKILNERFPFNPDDNMGRGATNRYRANKRPYGDYLWFTDRGQFNFDKSEYEAGRL